MFFRKNYFLMRIISSVKRKKYIRYSINKRLLHEKFVANSCKNNFENENKNMFQTTFYIMNWWDV